jgi:hypothetical protein
MYDSREGSFMSIFANLFPQSAITAAENVASTAEPNASETIAEVVQFLDEDAGSSVGFNTQYDAVAGADTEIASADLANYLTRPVKIATFTWNESDTVNTTHSYSPWNLYFTHAAIKSKLNNYAFIKCDLKIKILINASPFYYGAMIASYEPLPSFSPNGYNSIVAGTGTQEFIPYSQRPHLWIYPQLNAGGEMTLPFFLQRNFLYAQKASDMTDMGELVFKNYTILRSANGISGTGVTVQIFAWAENVSLSGPSLGLAVQAKTTYDGPISGPASAIAEAAGALKKIPLISSYATAAQMGANYVAKGAKALGFTNLPITEDVCPYRPAAIGPLSSSEISYPMERLCLDPKNELSIDPKIVGLDSVDELSMSHLVQRESYLTTLTWNTSDSTDTMLFASAVSPQMYDTDAASVPKTYMTPMCWLAYNFHNWKGDVIFRFRFIASQYHKGRVRVSFDPTGDVITNINSVPDSMTTVYTEVIDLGKDTDVEIRVPYTQAQAWLNIGSNPSGANIRWRNSTVATKLSTDGLDNGMINMRVLTALTAPVGTSSVNVLVFVRGADNMEFANPNCYFADGTKNFSWLPPQSLVKSEPVEEGDKQQLVAGVIHSPSPERYLVNFGEAVQNLRQVLRRSSLSCVRQPGTLASTPYVLWRKQMSRWPVAYGYDSVGIDLAKSLSTATIFPFNWNYFHPISYISAPFIATRGSVMWHVNVCTTATVGHVRVTRMPFTTTSPAEALATLASAGSTTSKVAAFIIANASGGSGGSSATNQTTQSSLAVSLPNYSPFKFQSAAPSNPSFMQAIDGSANEGSIFEVMFSSSGASNINSTVWMYACAGSDYNLHFFLNVPVLYDYGAIPVAG